MQIQHLQASDLIRLETPSENHVDAEVLRHADLDMNQIKLISGFHKMRNPDARHIVIDSHTVIDGPNGYSRIPAEVFKLLGVHLIVMLLDDPQVIAERRNRDTGRERPLRSAQQLTEYQDLALAHGAAISLDLRTPFVAIPMADMQTLRSFLL